MNGDMEDNVPYLALRRLTMRKTIWFSILICLLTEIIFYLVYRFIEKTLSDDGYFEYIIRNILRPTAINIAAALFYHITEAIFKNESIKSFTMFSAFSVICFDITFTHFDMPILLTLFCLPIFLTIMFASKKLTSVVALINLLLFAVVIYIAYTSATLGIPLTFKGYYSNVVIAMIIVICSYIFTNMMINYEVECRYMATTNQKHQHEIFEQVKRDPLTNLYNQKIFYDSLAISMKQCDKVCVAVIDIDNFKLVNDTYGHSIGDVVLVRLSDMLRSVSSKSILTARYGGEEFSIIFKDMNELDSFEIMEKLRQDFSEYEFEQMDGKSITFSCGISGPYPQLMSNVEFFDEADEALYYAKSNGKNQTIIYNAIKDAGK